MGNSCGSILDYCFGSSDDTIQSLNTDTLENIPRSSESLLREVRNPHAKALMEVDQNAKTNFHSSYVLGRKLGSGAFATVYECGELATKKTFACKVYDRKKLDAGALECALTEPYLLRRMYHPGILRCQGFYKEPDMYIMIMEELRGGDVFEKLREIKNHIHERDMCRLVKMFLEALEYIHARNIVHRDLKLENLMLDSTSATSSLKIVDFGFAIQLTDPNETLTEVLGTPGYMAPEVIVGGPYSKPADIWSAGVVVYTLLCGYPPFHHDRISNIQTLFRSICYGYYFFDEPYWNDISLEAKDLISKMLKVNATERLTATELLNHEWFAQQAPPLPPSPRATANTLKVIGSLRSFNRILRAKVAQHHQDELLSQQDQSIDPRALDQLAQDKIRSLESKDSDVEKPNIDITQSRLLPTTRYNVH